MTTEPSIFQINWSDGGVPKIGIQTAGINELGIVQDRHRDLKHHGGPDRALCLYAIERIVALQREGHPIFPGSTGENITTIGVDHDLMVPGTRWRLGDTVEIEITSYTVPCRIIRESFRDRSFVRISQTEHPGWSRVYARILARGSVSIGDRIVRLG